MNFIKAISLSVVFLYSGLCYGQKKVSYMPPAGNGFAVLELFTSEGCSSCPAADRAMVDLAEEYKHNFYVMEFHVDYWNYLGWKDEFSDKAYTERQQHYASLFRLSSTYTPQVIINGAIGEVGSDKAKIRPFINRDMLKEPKASLKVSATAHMSKVFVAYTIANSQGQLLNIALVQNKALTNVRRGENEGRKLTHTNIVRDFKTIDLIENHGFVAVYLPQGIVAEECSVIAYTQNKDTWEVTSGAQCVISVENH